MAPSVALLAETLLVASMPVDGPNVGRVGARPDWRPGCWDHESHWGMLIVTGGIRNRLWLARRMALLKLRGRVRHGDRFGLSYWLWANTRALGTARGEPRTDDTGVLEQLKRVYDVIGSGQRETVSVDVGAYIGVISLAMARFGGPNHAVHSFEADDLNYERLRLNVSDVPDTPIFTHNTAVGNQVGTAEFTRNEDPGTNSLSAVAGSSGVRAGVYMVAVTTLDAFAREQSIDEIDVVKIDMEGADLDVLRGAQGLLSGGRVGAVIVEIPLTPERRAEMNTMLEEQGLATAYIVRNSTKLEPASESVYAGSTRSPLNMLAVKPDLGNRLGIGW